MNNNTKVVLGAIVGLFAISLVLRFVVLSQVGVSGGWIFYLGLPIGGIVAILLLLMRLGLLNFGEGSTAATVQDWQHTTAVQEPLPVSPPLETATSRRLEELETLHTHGILSDTQYAAERTRIISGI
jgi:hypothetical protein